MHLLLDMLLLLENLRYYRASIGVTHCNLVHLTVDHCSETVDNCPHLYVGINGEYKFDDIEYAEKSVPVYSI